MVGWHHRRSGPEFEQALGDGEGQGSLASCSSWGCKESDTTERLDSSSKARMEGQLLKAPWLSVAATGVAVPLP